MPEATLTTKGQLVIPQSVQEHLRLEPGDWLDFVIRDTGEVVITPAGRVDVRELKGILPRPRKPVSVAEMESAIRERASGTA